MGGVEGPACRSGQEEPLLLTFLLAPPQPLTHQQQPGSGLMPSGRPLGANAAPHSPQNPPRWTPPQLRAAAGPAEGPCPGHLPQSAGRVGSGQGDAEPWAPCSLPHLSCTLHWEDQGPSLPKLQVCVGGGVVGGRGGVVQVRAPPPSHPRGWVTKGSIWAQPLGPLHRQEPETREARATWCVSPALLCIPSCLLYPAQPLPGVFPAGPLVSSPAQRSWEAVTMATGGSLGLLWAHCSVPTRVCGGCLPRPS